MSQGTETRQRTKLMGVRLLPEEHERLRAAAARQGISMSELVITLVRTSAPDLLGADTASAAPSVGRQLAS